MDNKANNPVFMKNYLGYAMEFEKFVYLWQEALNEANGALNRVQTQKKGTRRRK